MRILLFITGFVSSSVQFIMLREIVCLSGGSEITTGIFLAFWLILSSLGAATAREKNNVDLRVLFLLFFVAPLISLLCLLVSGRLLLHAGEVPSLLKTVLIITVTLTPTALISARTFIILSAVRKEKLEQEAGRSFGIETVGSIVAGVLSSVTALLFFRSFQYYLFVLVISGFAASVVLLKSSAKTITITLAGAVSIAILLIVFPPDNLIRSIQLRNISTTDTYDTPYGNITKGVYNGEETVYYDFRPLFYINDNVRCEEDIHYAMLQAKKHDKILLISGGLMNHAVEIAKYKPASLIYIEHDPGLIRVENIRDTLFRSMRINVISEDAFGYLKKNNEDFDVIIQLVPQPSTLSVNRYYCSEYFMNIKKNLAKDGIYVCAPLPAYNYASENYLKVLSPLVAALRLSFRNVTFIQGNMLYIISSDAVLTNNICQLITEKGINNTYVNCNYLDDANLNSRSNLLMSQLDKNAAPNRILKPVTAWFGNSFLLEKQGVGTGVLIAISLLMILPFVKIKRPNLIMYSSSAGLAGLGMIVIFLFQTTLGNAHLLSAIVLSLIMTGLATGASLRSANLKSNIIYPVGIALIFIVTGCFSLSVSSLQMNFILLSLVLILVLFAGILAGSLYRMLTLGGSKGTISSVYAADLSGSAAGYLVTGTIFIPLAGITITSFILAGIILLSVTLVPVKAKL